MKKIRELLRGKRWKWTIGGVGCLLVAAVLLGLTSEIGVRAEQLTLGSSTVEFEITDDNGQTIYLIKTADQLQKLREATASETNGKIFRLNQDLSISIATPATKEFAGILDGAGHVLTITSLQLSNSTTGETAQVDGALFGTVSGKVQNLIVDITDSAAKYIRTTKTGVTENESIVYSPESSPETTATVSGFDSDTTIVEKILEISKKTDGTGGTETKTEDGNTVNYVWQKVTEEGTKTITYLPKAVGKDSFGIICGNLTGELKQIYLNGKPLLVERTVNTAANYSKTTQAVERTTKHYYTETTKSSEVDLVSTNTNLTVVYPADDTPSIDEHSDNDKKFTATLKAEKNNGSGIPPYTVTLTLKNENTTSGIIPKKDIYFPLGTDWDVKSTTNENYQNDGLIPAGGQVVLEYNCVAADATAGGSLSVPIVGKFRQEAKQYTFRYTDRPLNGTPKGDVTNIEPAIQGGNYLYAGTLAGTSSGTITECKQSIDVTGIEVENEFKLGGIVGKADSGSLSDIYMLGRVNSSLTYVGAGTLSSTTPSNSATTAAEAKSLGEDSSNTTWSTYQEFITTESSTTGGDLAWLVKEESSSDSYFTYSEPNSDKKITVDIFTGKRITDKDLSYAIVYNARKNMTDTKENTLYLSTDGSMDLGDSGYYRIKHAYATDGYYHYQTPVTDISTVTTKYPYLTSNTPAPSIQSATIVRESGSVTDSVKVTMNNATTGTVYYELLPNIPSSIIPTGTSSSETITSGVVQLPFDTNDVYYRLVPVIGGKIYPALTTESKFTQNDRDPLPKPTVTCYDFYNSSGALNSYTAFVKNGSYQEGSDMKITPQDSTVTGYELQYLFSTTAPENEKWDENQRYTGTEENPSFFSGASKYEDGAVIPDKPADNADVYLYVQVKKNNYASQIYYYGPFKVTAKDVLSAQINGVAVVDDNYRVLEQDVVTITGVDANKIQTMVSKTAVSGSSWNFTSSNTIAMRTTSGGYVYARIKYGNNKYSEIQLFEFTFGDKCTKPRVTPNTGLVNGSATSISPATKVTLSSPTPDAKFFYLESEDQQTFTLTRATSIPDNVSDGGKKDGYRYFQVGNRWYKTSSDKVEKYTGELSFTNDENNSKTIYLSVAAVADDYEASETVDYIYTIQPKQQVANPQAALETRNSSSGGNNVDIAPVRRGANIAFYTETPEAKLYYTTSTDATSLTEAIPAEGIEVTGDFGENFVVRVQAKKAGMLDSDIITFIYEVAAQDTVMTPTATPGTSAENPTTVIPGNKILLSSTTKEATIFYTTNGTSPLIIDNGDGTFSSGDPATTMKYDPNQGIVMPLDGSGYFMITAVAVKKDLANSPEAHFTYTYPAAVLEPYATMDSGYVTLDSAVYLKNVTENAVIYYTVAYGDQTPEDPSFTSAVFNEEYPFTITQKTTIKAMAAKDGVRSKIASFTFIPMAQLEVPKASIESGSVVARGTVLELKTLQGAGVYYTMDGSDPLDPANTAVLSGNTITLNGEPGAQITIKAYAKASDKSPSQVVTFTYQISQNTGGIIASIENGSLVSNGTKVNLMSDVTNAEIYYTTDGSSPIDHGIKGTTVEINGIPGNTFTIKAVAVVAGEKGVITTFVYKIKEKPTAPTASPAGGVLTIATRVSLSSGAEFIYYTTDGTEPTKSSTSYAEPILINRATTLKAIAVSKDGEVSEVAEYIYTAAPKAGIVTSSAGDGSTLQPGRKISLSTLTDGAVIYYSTDGTIPTMDNLDSMLVYDGEPIEINRSVTLQAVAYREDLRLSDVAIWNYTVEQIPAVLQKEAEAKKLAQEGLQETDASALARTTQENQTLPRKMKEQENNTQIVYSAEALPLMAKLSTSKEENSYLVTEKAKEIFGQDYTVLETYQFRVKDNNTSVQPKEEVEVAIPIPKGYEDAVLTVAYVEENRPLTTLETRRENEMLYAKTKKLGTFVIVGTMQEEKTAGKLSYLPILEAVAGITLLGGMGYFGFLKIQKFLKKRKKTTQRSEDNPKGV